MNAHFEYIMQVEADRVISAYCSELKPADAAEAFRIMGRALIVAYARHAGAEAGMSVAYAVGDELVDGIPPT